MRKIKDRMTLGVVTGLIGNASKQLLGQLLIKKFRFGNLDGQKIEPIQTETSKN